MGVDYYLDILYVPTHEIIRLKFFMLLRSWKLQHKKENQKLFEGPGS